MLHWPSSNLSVKDVCFLGILVVLATPKLQNEQLQKLPSVGWWKIIRNGFNRWPRLNIKPARLRLDIKPPLPTVCQGANYMILALFVLKTPKIQWKIIKKCRSFLCVICKDCLWCRRGQLKMAVNFFYIPDAHPLPGETFYLQKLTTNRLILKISTKTRDFLSFLCFYLWLLLCILDSLASQQCKLIPWMLSILPFQKLARLL